MTVHDGGGEGLTVALAMAIGTETLAPRSFLPLDGGRVVGRGE
jgi:hypothetical protein